ncbi:UNVERIFIED_CONTAM: Retrovirus-related Pol polyprotein from transposon RE2 [Sesamum radiatum]|uniref:Retrovirus-related Pol polyprotein from transposon RE2 n=1 Tax=Sesamum radiatum TaxID=300843 RepID=A0AAW2LDJ2_SESRA
MDPIRFVNKAYSMVQSVERQKEVHMEIADTGDHTAMHVQAGIHKDISFRGDQKRRNFVDKRQLYCEHCAKSGHTKDKCFKIHGTPDWYKDLVEQKRKDVNGTGSGMNCTLTNLGDNVLSYWIVDTGATNHMGANPHILSSLVHTSTPTTSGLPQKFWGESVLTATFLINRLPTPLLHWKSPFEVLHQRSPDYEQLKVFGCLYFASNVNPHKAKFDQRALRDVMFHETTYPFQSIPPENDPISLPLPIDDTDPIPSSRVSNSKSHLLPINSPTVSVSPGISPTNITLPIPLSTRPQRHVSKPAWMCDYICSCATDSSSCTPDTYSLAHKCFVAQCSSVQEPKTYLQASKDANWVMGMQEELQALDKNGTWELTSLPPIKRAIGSKWVFKLKLHLDGSIARYKVRLVAKGYNQIEGVDYFDSFSPVAKSVIVAKSKSWALFQLDINNALLHGHLDEEVYMDHPERYLAAKPGQMCRLRRSLYDLKQASRQWNLELTTKLLDYGFTQSAHDNCLFLNHTGSDFIALLVYVDDILLTGALLQFPDRYRHLVRRLLYLGFTLLDLSFPVQQLSQYMQHLRTSHWDVALHVLRYLKGSCNLGLFFPSQNSLRLTAYSDATWASCPNSRRSITGFCVFLGGSSLVED